MKRYLVFLFLFLAFPLFLSTESNAQFSATILEINPDNSTYDATDPDGASGGRVNGLGAAGDGSAFYAASEWGGIFKSIDRGMSWFRLNAHLPVAAWDVEVDPLNSNKVYATSFYDGRVNSMAGINVSFDGGLSWVHPTITVPYSPYSSTERLEEPSAFGISIGPENNNHVYIGTNTGLAVSTDAGNTWEFIDPTPSDPASNIWDVVVHHGGIIDIIGDDGHLRSTDGGGSWFGAPIGLPSGRGSIAASPHEPDVIFAAIAENLYESDDGGGNWTMLGTPDQRRKRQGRIPFVVTNPRTNSTFDVWYGDARLYRGYCNSNPSGGGLRCPQAYTNPMPLPPAAPSLPLPNGWAGPFTRYAGGHDDVGDLIIEPDVDENGCPVLFSSDGGVYYNTLASTSQCQDPYWEQPLVTPHGLWLFGFDGANRPGGVDEYLYFGNQDNGPFVSNNAGAAAPAWFNRDCCDGFDDSAGPNIVLYTLCCFSGGRSNQLFRLRSTNSGGLRSV